MKLTTNEKITLNIIASISRIQRGNLVRRLKAMSMTDEEQQKVLDQLQIEYKLIDSDIQPFLRGENKGRTQFFFITDAGQKICRKH